MTAPTAREVRVVEAPEDGGRIETGVTQFGDDWPGVFIRGDSAFGYALALGSVLKGEADKMQRARADGLLRLLRSSNVHALPDAPERDGEA